MKGTTHEPITKKVLFLSKDVSLVQESMRASDSLVQEDNGVKESRISEKSTILVQGERNNTSC